MKTITLNLTPNKSFINFDINEAEKKVYEMFFEKKIDKKNFRMYVNKNKDILKIRKDGKLFYKINMQTIDNKTFSNIYDSLKQIIDNINCVYDGLLDTNEFSIYWPEGIDYKDLYLPNYSITTSELCENKYCSYLIKNCRYQINDEICMGN